MNWRPKLVPQVPAVKRGDTSLNGHLLYRDTSFNGHLLYRDTFQTRSSCNNREVCQVPGVRARARARTRTRGHTPTVPADLRTCGTF